MMALTEELGLVGRNGIEQCCLILHQAPFVEQPLAIFVHRCEPERTQVPPDTTFKKRFFRWGHLDARASMNKLRQPDEVPSSQRPGFARLRTRHDAPGMLSIWSEENSFSGSTMITNCSRSRPIALMYSDSHRSPMSGTVCKASVSNSAPSNTRSTCR